MSFLATSVPITDDGEEIVRVPYFYYSVCFQEDQRQKNQGQEGQEYVRALLISGSKINTLSPAYIKKLGLKTWKTNIGVQKIDSSTLETFEMVIADFKIEAKVGRPRIF